MKTTTRIALLLACTISSLALAQSVSLTGMLGGKALVIVDGSPPKTVAVGDTYKGVKVVSTQGDQAVVEMDGKQVTLRVGDAPANVGGAIMQSGDRVVLPAGAGGHFFAMGQINGKSTRMVVDTGATAVGISEQEAQRIGLKYTSGEPLQMSTANGVINGWHVKLATVRVGDVVLREVDAVVSAGSMPVVLLGNTFLSHFEMKRTNDQMILEKRY